MTNMIWFCLDCQSLVEMSKHGRCSTCQSQALAVGYHTQEWQAQKEVKELEEMWLRK